MKALPAKSGPMSWMGLIEILHHLSLLEEPEVLSSSRYQHARSSKILSRLERVIRHIDQHFREELPLAEVARIAGLTPSSFCTLLHPETMGIRLTGVLTLDAEGDSTARFGFQIGTTLITSISSSVVLLPYFVDLLSCPPVCLEKKSFSPVRVKFPVFWILK